MSHTGKKVCLVISIICAIAFLCAAIGMAVVTVKVRNLFDGLLKFDYGTQGTQITPGSTANSTVIKAGTVNAQDLVLYRWDHNDGDQTNTHLTALVINSNKNQTGNNTISTVGLCVSSYSQPTLAQCKTSNYTDVAACYSVKGSIYVGVYTTGSATVPYEISIRWSSQTYDNLACTGVSVVGGLGTIGVMGVGIIAGVFGCCFLTYLLSSIKLAFDVKKHHGYHQV